MYVALEIVFPSCINTYIRCQAKKLSKERFVVFYVATHGEGEPTDTSIEFDEWIHDDERELDELENVHFSVSVCQPL